MSVKKIATFQERLTEALNEKDMTQSALAIAVGMSRYGINKYGQHGTGIKTITDFKRSPLTWFNGNWLGEFYEKN